MELPRSDVWGGGGVAMMMRTCKLQHTHITICTVGAAHTNKIMGCRLRQGSTAPMHAPSVNVRLSVNGKPLLFMITNCSMQDVKGFFIMSGSQEGRAGPRHKVIITLF